MDSGSPLALLGVAALLISALLTAIYMLTIVVRAYFPGKDFDYGAIADVDDPNWMMLVPLGVFAFLILFFGLCSGQVSELLRNVLQIG